MNNKNDDFTLSPLWNILLYRSSNSNSKHIEIRVRNLLYTLFSLPEQPHKRKITISQFGLAVFMKSFLVRISLIGFITFLSQLFFYLPKVYQSFQILQLISLNLYLQRLQDTCKFTLYILHYKFLKKLLNKDLKF